MLAHWPTGRRIAVSALVCVGVAVLIATTARGLSDTFLIRAAQTLAIAAAAVAVLGLVVSIVYGRLADYREPADEPEDRHHDRDPLDRAQHAVAVEAVEQDDQRQPRAQRDGRREGDAPQRGREAAHFIVRAITRRWTSFVPS